MNYAPERHQGFAGAVRGRAWVIGQSGSGYSRIDAVKDQGLFLSLQESELVENLFGPLRQAKTSCPIGNCFGAIGLCGMVVEKMAILIHAINTPDEGAWEGSSLAGLSHKNWMAIWGQVMGTYLYSFSRIESASVMHTRIAPANTRVLTRNVCLSTSNLDVTPTYWLLSVPHSVSSISKKASASTSA